MKNISDSEAYTLFDHVFSKSVRALSMRNQISPELLRRNVFVISGKQAEHGHAGCFREVCNAGFPGQEHAHPKQASFTASRQVTRGVLAVHLAADFDRPLDRAGPERC